MLRTFIQVLALALSFISAYFLIKGVMQLSTNDMAQLSQTCWGYNLKVAKGYCHQRADYTIGFILLVCASILQGINLLWAMRWNDFAVNKVGAISAVIVALVIGIIAYGASVYLYNTSYHKVESILKKAR